MCRLVSFRQVYLIFADKAGRIYRILCSDLLVAALEPFGRIR